MVSKRRLLIALAAVVGGSTMLAGPAYADRAVVITPDTAVDGAVGDVEDQRAAAGVNLSIVACDCDSERAPG